MIMDSKSIRSSIHARAKAHVADHYQKHHHCQADKGKVLHGSSS